MGYLHNNLSEEQLKKINYEVAYINQEYAGISAGCLKEDIFGLLEKIGTLIFTPIEEASLWGIYVFKEEKHFFIINSKLELEKKIFAAAHELAHSLDIAKVKVEIVTVDLLTEYVEHKEYGQEIQIADSIANRFAAELLVGKKKLEKKYYELPEDYSLSVKAVLLSDFFLVPYRTIVKRFLETGLILENEINTLLDVEGKQIKNIAERYECCRKNYEISEEIRLGGYINKALMLYEHELSTYKELEELLSLLGKTPEDYGIQNDSFDSYEFLRRASVITEVEDIDDSE